MATPIRKETDVSTTTPKAKKKVAPKVMTSNPAAKQDFTPEPNSFIVRNITPSILFISDLGVTFKPLQVMDLTHEDGTKVNASKDLRVAIKQGQLQRISRKEQDLIENMEIATERAKLIRDQKERQRQLVEVDDKELDAEVLNLNAPDRGVLDEEVSTAGHTNDPLTYATAYSAAVAEAASNGEYLDAGTFQKMVEDNPKIIDQYLTRSVGRGVTSGTTRRGRATVMMPPMGDSGETSAAKIKMTNFARDHELAGASQFDVSVTEVGFGEEIDLAEDD